MLSLNYADVGRPSIRYLYGHQERKCTEFTTELTDKSWKKEHEGITSKWVKITHRNVDLQCYF